MLSFFLKRNKRKDTSSNEYQNVGKETNETSNGGRKRSRQVWAIEVSNVKLTLKVMNELESFFINRVCTQEKKLVSKGLFVNGNENNESSRSFYFEFVDQSQQQAALKLDGADFDGLPLKIRPSGSEGSDTSSTQETPVEDCDTTHGIKESAQSVSEPIESHTLPQDENEESDKKSEPGESADDNNNCSPHDNIVSLQQLEAEIGEKARLLASANEHIQALTETNSKYEKRLADQLNQIEELNSRLQSQQGEMVQSNANQRRETIVEGGSCPREKMGDQSQDQIREKGAGLGMCQSPSKAQKDQEEPIRTQENRIKDLEAKLTNKQTFDDANEKKIESQRQYIAILEAKLKKFDPKAAVPSSNDAQQQQRNSPQVSDERRLDVTNTMSTPTLPPNVEASKVDPIGEMSVVQREQCAKILIGLKVRQPRNVGMFLQPVSDLRIIDDYRRKIANPMDLGTMHSKLEQNMYQTPAAFVLDLRCIFANCLIYNTLGNPYRQVAFECLETAEQLTSVFLAQPEQQIAVYPPLLFCWKHCLNVLDALSTLTNPYDGAPTVLYFLFPIAFYCGGQFPPDYLAKVTKPMDFGTVTKQLIEGRYATVDQFEADCLLVLDNCTLYYGRREDGAVLAEQANRLRAVLQEQMSVLKKYIKSPLGEALRRTAQNAVKIASLLEPPVQLLQCAELGVSQSEIESQEQQRESIKNQVHRIKGLEEELKKQQLDNVAKEKKIGTLETGVASKNQKIENQRSALAGLHKKLKARNLEDGAAANTQQGVANKILQKQLNDSVQENGNLRVDLLAKELAREKESLQKQVNDSIQQNGSLRADFRKQEQAIKHQFDVTKTQLRRLRHANKNQGRSQFKDNYEVAEHSIATLKGTIRRLIDEMRKGGAMERKAKEGAKVEKLEAKLVKTLQDQSKLLAENQQLRRSKQTMQQTMEVQEKEKERLLEENEELEEEMEQIKMNHAMEIGFLKGTSS